MTPNSGTPEAKLKRAVDRIDDEGEIGLAQPLEQRRIGGCGLLADDQRPGISLTSAGR